MAHYLLINSETETVENIISYDGVTAYNPGAGYYLMPKEDAEVAIGWHLYEGVWHAPEEG